MRTPNEVAVMSRPELIEAFEAGPVETTTWGLDFVRLSDPDPNGWFYGATFEDGAPGYGTYSIDQVAAPVEPQE